jgi:pimeloyl-ACP methyl ester carboxylesterase
MWPILAPLIDEMGAAVIGRLFLWRRSHKPSRRCPRTESPPTFDGNLQAYYRISCSPVPWEWTPTKRSAAGASVCDGHFRSPVHSGYPDNDSVRVRRWSGSESKGVAIGLGGLVQLGYHWFDRLGDALAARGVDLWMMDEPFNHRRTPQGYLPGELIAGYGPEELLAAVRQAVLDLRTLIAHIRRQGLRVGLIGQSFGGWLSLLVALLEDDLDFVVPLIPLCDLVSWYRSALPLARGARRHSQEYSNSELNALLAPINPIAWKPVVPTSRIHIHAATRDRMVLYRSIQQLAHAWGTHFTAHQAGHYSVFFGNHLRDSVIDFVQDRARPGSPVTLPESYSYSCSYS